MEHWKRVTVMVTIITFSLQIRPMESFITAYLTGPRADATLYEVSDVLTPITIYMSVLSSLLTLLFSDYLRYKPIMIFFASMGILSYLCLVDSSTLFILKVYEVSYSFLKCTDPLYFGYLFATIKDKKHYQIATGFAMSGIMSGIAVSGLLGQLVVYLNNGDYTPLIYYSLAGVTLATVLSVFLPPVKRENKWHTFMDDDDTARAKSFSKEVIHDPGIPKYSSENDCPQNTECEQMATNPFKCMYKFIIQSYSDYTVFHWSLWDAMNMINIMQINLYVNILYSYIVNISEDKNMLLNGLVNFLATISGAICAYKIGKINVDWTRHGDTFMAFSAFFLALTMYFCYCSTNNIVVYVTYIFYSIMAESVYVIAVSQIGKQLKNSCYGLVLGFNVFIGIVFATFLSEIMTHLGTSIPGHFLVYSCTYMALGIMYGYLACFNTCATTKHFERLP